MVTELRLFPESAFFNRNHLTKSDKLLHIFESIHNYIYANDGLSSQEAFIEMLHILFVKIFDEKSNLASQFKITAPEFELLSKGKNSPNFKIRITKLYQLASNYFSDVLEKKREIKLSFLTLAYVVNKLQGINLSLSSQDVKGLAFQKFLHTKQRSERGQFFTPEQVVKLCVQFIKPTDKCKILDPACGSGGFLSQAMNYIHINYLQDKDGEEIKEFANQNIYGIEINQQVAKVAEMRMLLDNDSSFKICVTDALSDWSTLNYKMNLATGESSSYEGFFDLILTNPPFGSKGKIHDESVLNRFELGHKWMKRNQQHYVGESLIGSQVSDILFIERCLDFLKDKGKLAIVLPNGIFENSSLEYVRWFINRRARVLGVVRLPPETFIPFGTGVKASVLFLQKLNSGELKELKTKNYEIFFSAINKLGYLGNKNGTIVYKKDKNGQNMVNEKGDSIIDEDYSVAIKAYEKFLGGNFTSGSDNYFSIKYNEYTSRLDFDFYKPSYKNLENMLIKHNSKRMGEVVGIIKRVDPDLKNKNTLFEYVELADINSEYLEITKSDTMYFHELPSRATFVLKEGDIVTAVAGNSIGSPKHMSALVTKEFDGAICTNGLRILKPKEKIIDPFYLLFYLRTPFFLKQVLKYRTGAAIPSISDKDLLRIFIYIPPLNEQKSLANKVRRSFELRLESRKLLTTIKLGISLKI